MFSRSGGRGSGSEAAGGWLGVSHPGKSRPGRVPLSAPCMEGAQGGRRAAGTGRQRHLARLGQPGAALLQRQKHIRLASYPRVGKTADRLDDGYSRFVERFRRYDIDRHRSHCIGWRGLVRPDRAFSNTGRVTWANEPVSPFRIEQRSGHLTRRRHCHVARFPTWQPGCNSG